MSNLVCTLREGHTLGFLLNEQRDAQLLFYVFISIYNCLHVSSISCSSSGATNCINTGSGNSHSMLVAKMCVHIKATSIEWLLPEAVLIQFVSPEDEHDMLETCRESQPEINTKKRICESRWSFTKNHYMMNGQQNVKNTLGVFENTEIGKEQEAGRTYTWGDPLFVPLSSIVK